MPNRYIRASAIESESVNALTWQGEVFYRRLLNRADDFGRYTANPNLLRASLFPLQLDRVSIQDIAQLLAECVKTGLVFLYGSAGKPLLVMNKFEKGRAKYSEYPEPPPEVIKHMQTYVYISKGMHPTPTPTPTPTPISDSAPDAASEAGSTPPSYFPEVERPSEKEVRDYAQTIGLSEWKALDWFEEMQGCNWKDYQRREIHDWRAVMRRVKTKWEADGRPNQPPTRLIPGEKPRGKSIHQQDAERLKRQAENL